MVRGYVKWFGGFDKQRNRPNHFGFIQLSNDLSSEDVFVHRQDVALEWQSLLETHPGLCVDFEVIEEKKGKRALHVRPAVFLGIVDYFGKGLIGYEENNQILLVSLKQSLFYSSGTIISFYIVRKQNGAQSEAIVDKVIGKDITDEQTQEKAARLLSKVQYKGEYWSLILQEFRAKIIRERYRKFFEILSQFENANYPLSEHLSCPWKDLYELDEQDKKLIDIWSSNKNDPHEQARLISARGAEKLVLAFYRAAGYKSVVDVSIQQVESRNDLWKKCDILVDGSLMLDVKNARQDCLNSRKYYSQFCVPSFKKSRGEDVQIIAVLSPYLKYEFISRRKEPSFVTDNPIILGLTNHSKIQDLVRSFQSEQFQIQISYNLKNYLPPWLFDYNDGFYVEVNQAIDEFLRLGDTEIPDWDDIQTCQVNPLPLGILARYLPDKWLSYLPKWESNFLKSLLQVSQERITLPHLFLSMLKHALQMLASDISDYSPSEYRKILGRQIWKEEFSIDKPLKIFDPLDMINTLCTTLEILWQNRHSSNLQEYKIFKLAGEGILQGKKCKEDTQWTTLLAYCGGWIDDRARCGYRYLIIGCHTTCPSCQRLVCPKCGFCSERCQEYLRRKAKISYSSWSSVFQV